MPRMRRIEQARIDGRPRQRSAVACLLAILLLGLSLSHAFDSDASSTARQPHAVSAAHARGALPTVRTAPDVGPALPSLAAFELRVAAAPTTFADAGRPAAPSRTTPRETLPRSPPGPSPIA